jgi:hypothetical protein
LSFFQKIKDVFDLPLVVVIKLFDNFSQLARKNMFIVECHCRKWKLQERLSAKISFRTLFDIHIFRRIHDVFVGHDGCGISVVGEDLESCQAAERKSDEDGDKPEEAETKERQ